MGYIDLATTSEGKVSDSVDDGNAIDTNGNRTDDGGSNGNARHQFADRQREHENCSGLELYTKLCFRSSIVRYYLLV